MATPPLLRWGLTFSFAFALIALALAFRLQQTQQPLIDLASPVSSPVTHCYRRVRTQDEDQPTAECFSVVNGNFDRVWTTAEDAVADLSDYDDSDVAVRKSDGYVIPGLWDGHGHLLAYGEFLHSVDLFGSESLDEVRSRIKKYLAANPDAGTKEQWLRGVGWDQTAFGRMPTADDIEEDSDLKGIYMMLDRIDVHCSWVSQSVLDLLPVDLPDVVPGGEIVRDPGMGVFCDNAMDIVMRRWPSPSRDMKAAAVRTAMAKLNEFGLVGMHDAGATPETLRMYAEMAGVRGSSSSSSDDNDGPDVDGDADDEDGAVSLADSDSDWTVRVYSMLECDVRNTFCPDAAVKFSSPDARFTVRSVKLFADGALGSWGSAMLEPYTDHPWTSGSLLVNASTLTEVAVAWATEGYQVNIHAIGDLANRNAVDAFVAALEKLCPGEVDKGSEKQESQQEREDRLAACQATHRFRIEHSQIIHPDDQQRIHALGIIPSIQPTHATSDMRYALSRLGADRTAHSAYRMKSLLDARPVLGSDFPVEPPDPFQGIFAAVARRSPHTGLGADGGDPKKGWHMEEALSVDEALWGFTGGAAHGAFLDGRAGVIRPGALADWVVLDEPIEETDIEKFRNLTVRETWVGGRRVYARESVAAS